MKKWTSVVYESIIYCGIKILFHTKWSVSPKGDALKERKRNVAGEDRRQMD